MNLKILNMHQIHGMSYCYVYWNRFLISLCNRLQHQQSRPDCLFVTRWRSNMQLTKDGTSHVSDKEVTRRKGDTDHRHSLFYKETWTFTWREHKIVVFCVNPFSKRKATIEFDCFHQGNSNSNNKRISYHSRIRQQLSWQWRWRRWHHWQHKPIHSGGQYMGHRHLVVGL